MLTLALSVPLNQRAVFGGSAFLEAGPTGRSDSVEAPGGQAGRQQDALFCCALTGGPLATFQIKHAVCVWAGCVWGKVGARATIREAGMFKATARSARRAELSGDDASALSTGKNCVVRGRSTGCKC